MGYRLLLFLVLLALSVGGCTFVRFVPDSNLKTEIAPTASTIASTPASTPQVATGAGTIATVGPPTNTPGPPTVTPTATPTPYFLQELNLPRTMPRPTDSYQEGRLVQNVEWQPPRHGLLIAVLLPFLIVGVPWIFLELFMVRYTQPRGADLARVRIKAQDGLFIEAIVSMTARRELSLASTRMTWPRVSEFVEKEIEQELIHEALKFLTLQELEQNLKGISEGFSQLAIIGELSRDFGVYVERFNIETIYPPETSEALQRKGEASAGGTAYLAFAAAARLNPSTAECRELYRVYEETSGRVDAARNLGGGITTLASLLGQKEQSSVEQNESTSPKSKQ